MAKQEKEKEKELRKEELKSMIESLNESNDFFKSLGFSENIIKNGDEKEKSDESYFFRSEQDVELEFWVDVLEDENRPRYCFAYEIPSKIRNSEIADILPQVWWANDGSLGDHYEKIIFEYDRNTKIAELEGFENGEERSEDAVGNLKRMPVLDKDGRYIVYYLIKGKEKNSVKKFEEVYTTFFNFRERIMFKENIKELLLCNYNIILHGAPGTGKTYLAKEIAEAMGCSDDEIGFVQFHQSYDYTDFVEGLRPVKQDKGQIGFERKDGIFKVFCEKALNSVDEQIDQCIEKLKDKLKGLPNRSMQIRRKGSNITTIVLDTKGNLKAKAFSRKSPSSTKEYPIRLNGIHIYIKTGRYNTGHSTYETAVGDYIRKNYMPPKKAFVFIIDEINRGEMSKIFGELFFSIDPGYRGVEGKIKTQYANLQEVPNDFDKTLGIEKNEQRKGVNKVDLNQGEYGHFFVPENVYIIGTMNDIDRSVESMDFAMRRRFAFKEITAKDRVKMLGALKGKDDAVKRMDSLNKAIEEIPGLSAAYHIGPAYFLKLKKYEEYTDAFDKLWEYHIEGVLKEYLRGMDLANEKLEKLAKAFGYTKV
ncbi:MAG: AAA family ATPase [Fibrobacter sp.]|nr:AAA family ATPase [Fibrobacter sp.]